MTARCPAPDADGRWCEYVGGSFTCIRCGRRMAVGVDIAGDGTVAATVVATAPDSDVVHVLGHQRWTPHDLIAAVLRGEERAARDVARGIADLKAELDTAEEWDASAPIGDRARHITPKRQMLRGMLNHLTRHQPQGDLT